MLAVKEAPLEFPEKPARAPKPCKPAPKAARVPPPPPPAASLINEDEIEAGAESDYDATVRPKIFEMLDRPPENFEDLL